MKFQIWLGLLFVLLVGCRQMRYGVEFQIQKESRELLEREFPTHFQNYLKSEGTREFIEAQSKKMLDTEFPPDARATTRFLVRHGFKGVAASVMAVLMGWLAKVKKDLSKAKKRNGDAHEV